MRRVPIVISLILLIAVASVSLGWITHTPGLVRFMPDAAMVLNTALCFGLVAFALLSQASAPGARRRIQILLGAATALVAALILSEHILDRDLGIDWPDLHAWYRDDNPRPGRMSLPAALAFLLSGATLVLMHRVRGLWSGLLVQAVTGMVIIVGTIGIISSLLKLPLVYADYPFRQMSLSSAAGFVLAGAALWTCWRQEPWYVTRALIGNEAQRIGLNSVVVLASIVCLSMLAGLVIMQRHVDVLARDSLLWPLESRIRLFKIDIELRSGRAAMIATRPGIMDLLRRLRDHPGDQDILARLRESAASFLPVGFTAVAFLDPDGKEWVRAGRFSERPALAIPLSAEPQVNTLMWGDDSFVLRTRMPMISGSAAVGIVVAEQRLVASGAAMEYSQDFAATGEIAVCARQQNQLACFPQRTVQQVFTVPYNAALPMARALANEMGVMIARDERSRNVMAAYGPIGSLGLGMVVQMDTAELYAPMREQLYVVLTLALLMVAGGALLLYWSVTPLAQRLYLSDQRLKLALESSRTAWWDWDIRSGKIQLSEHWQAMLGQSPRPTETTLEELEKLVHPDDLPLVERKLRAALKSGIIQYDVEHRVRRSDGRWIWISSVGKVVERDPGNQALRMIGVNADISQRKESALRIEYQAKHDVLTGLPNRITFYDRLGQAMSRARRNKTLMAVMYLDIDKFKAINDGLGHAVGDLLLKDFAQRLAYCVRGVDTVARLGGDEFGVILEELERREDGSRIAEKIVREMRPEFPLEHHTVTITTSIGITFYEGKEQVSADQLVRSADVALYEAKHRGRDTYQVAA